MEFDIPDELIAKIKSRDCALFIGSGLSIAAGMPTWEGLLKLMIRECRKGSLPAEDERELLILLHRGDYLDVAEYCRHQLGEKNFKDFMAQVFYRRKYNLTANHLLLYQIPFSCIVTTNYDSLLERAY